MARPRPPPAELRALGTTRLQSRLVVVTQASVLAAIGLAVGVPLGFAVGRFVWRLVAQSTPLAYHPPLASGRWCSSARWGWPRTCWPSGRGSVRPGSAAHRSCGPSNAMPAEVMEP